MGMCSVNVSTLPLYRYGSHYPQFFAVVCPILLHLVVDAPHKAQIRFKFLRHYIKPKLLGPNLHYESNDKLLNNVC